MNTSNISNDDRKSINALLADILDDSKPLPSKPSVAKVVVNVQANGKKGNLGTVAMDDPESFLEALLNGPEPDAIDVAQSMEPQAEMALADEGITQVCGDGIFTDSGDRDVARARLHMPEFVPDDLAETMDIRNFATLVTLNTARWHAKVKDKRASRDAAFASDADENAFETRKRLLVGADEKLKAIHKVIDEARVAHYEMTLPWTTTGLNDLGRRTGGRLLPNTLFVDYTTKMAQFKTSMVKALNEFVPLYPSLMDKAKAKLGRSFNLAEYPNPSSIGAHFDLSFDFQPIPKGDDFKGLPSAQLKALANKINENTRRMTENAMQDVWMRLYDAVSRMAERLSSPDKTFHNTLVENVRDVARLLAHVNVTGDAKIETIRKRVEKELCQNDAATLREKPVLRLKVGAMATSIVQEMNK